MRYILDDLGYIEEVSNYQMTCKNKSCTEYKGTIPEGYGSLEEWACNSNIRAWKIVNGNLTFDSNRNTELQEEYNTATENSMREIITTVTYQTSELTLNAGNVHTITYNNISKSGYKAIGIIQIDSSNTNITLQKFSIWSTNAYVTIKNTSSSQQKFTETITVLFQKL